MLRTSSSGNDEALVDEDQRSPLLNSHPEALAQILDLDQPLDLDCCLLDPLPLLRRRVYLDRGYMWLSLSFNGPKRLGAGLALWRFGRSISLASDTDVPRAISIENWKPQKHLDRLRAQLIP